MTDPSAKRDLLQAARSAIESEAQKTEQRRAEERAASRVTPRRWLVPVFGSASLLLAALLITRPAFLIGRTELPAEAPSVRVANTRATLAVLAARLHAYRKSHGALPRALTELGAGVPADMAYERIDDARFVLRTTTAPLLSFGSEDDPSVLLKDQFTQLRRKVE